MATKARLPSRLRRETLELAGAMRVNGTMNEADHRKITMRDVAEAKVAPIVPLSGEQIRALRQGAKMSQAVFARYLNLTAGYVSQLEREIKHPAGAALALLDVIRRKGIDAVI